MPRVKFIGALCFAVVLFGAGCQNQTAKPVNLQTTSNQKSSMQLTSPAFKHNDALPKQYSCDGAGLHPPLNFDLAPTGTKSLTLIMEDPDAPNGTFVHWILFNISPDAKSITDTPGLSGKNSAGRTGYVSACPPTGQHRYNFFLFALDMMLELQAGATKEEIDQAMSGHVLEQVELNTFYSR